MTSRTRPDRVATELASWLWVGPVPAEPECGWDALLALADEHQLLPALWSNLRGRGVRPLPPRLGLERADGRPALAVLQAAYDDNAARVADLLDQGEHAIDALTRASIDAIPLKGLHWLLAGWLPDPASRVIVDLDLLVPAGAADAARAVLAGAGYRRVDTDDPEGMADHEIATLELPHRHGSVELQHEPFVRRHAGLLPAAEIAANAETVERDGRTWRVPNPTHGMVLAVGHAQLQDESLRLLRLPLRTLRDVAVALDAGAGELADWDEVAARFARIGAQRALAGFAVASAELFDQELPVPTRGGARWWRSVRAALRHPKAADRYREAVTLPRALSAARMERLYGALTPGARTSARVRHVGRGFARRIRRRPR